MRRTWLFLLTCLLLASASSAVQAASPAIVSVDVDRTTRSLAPGVVRYGEKITVKVSDVDGVDNIGCVTITDSGDPARTVTLSYCRGEGSMVNMTSASFAWTKPETLAPPPLGPYHVEAYDVDGNGDTLTTGTPPAVSPLLLKLTAPAMDSVITSTFRPTFQWQNSAATTKIEVYEEGARNLVWTKTLTAGTTSVLYANGGTVFYGRTQLLPNHSYLWSLNTGTGTAVYSEPGDPVTHTHVVTVKDWQEAHGRFAIYGAWGAVPLPPALPGRLAYATRTVTPLLTARYTSGVMGYRADPLQRAWLGPEFSDFPDWSPDGSKLVYATPVGLFVDDGSGLPAALVPGTSGRDAEARWTADGGRLVYAHRDNESATSDIWIANADGSDAHALVATTGAENGPAPSPNGAWVAYQRNSSLRLVRTDGSDDQALAMTGVAGQDPSYAVIAAGQPAWSPDGSALAVIFQARGSGLPDLLGIGTVPAVGGPVTPVFVSTLWTCCGYPQAPAWSPDGLSIVFSSAHHRPALVDYDIANALELWLAAADGSSAPVQLTNDFSMTRHVSWWAPNTPAAAGATVTREGVTVTFAGVSVEGVTQVLTCGSLNGPLPEGMELVGGPFDILTTAQYTGPVAIGVSAAALGLPPDTDLSSDALLHWEGGAWVNVTVPPGGPGVVEGECDSLGQFVVALLATPVADFMAAPQQGVAPLAVSFADASLGNPTSWSWDFGDGGTSAERNPSHEYLAAGTYTVALTAGNAGGTNTCTKEGFIVATVPAPVADFSAMASTGTVPLVVAFADASTNGPTAWSWTFGDGGTSTEQHPSHTYVSPGCFSVALTAANAGGSNTCSKADCITVTPPAPVAAFTAAPTQGIVPLTVVFSDASSGDPTSWSWDFGDGGIATQQSPAHTYTQTGTYSVTLVVSNAGGSSSESKSNYITLLPPPPTAAFSADVTVGPIPLTVQFVDQSAGGPTSWSWAFGDGGGSTEPAPSHTYVSPGAYTVALTVGNAGGATTETKVGYVAATVPPPVAGFTATPASGIVPLAAQFTDTSTGTPTGWAWDFGDGATAIAQNPAHTYAAPGVYTVTLTAGNAGGSSSCSHTVTALEPAPVASFTYTPANGTAPLAVQFTDTSSNNPTAWAWSFGDGGVSSAASPSHSYTTAGSFTVSLTAANGTGADTATVVKAITTTLTWQFVGPLPPIDPDGSSVFKKKPFVQVRFQLLYSDGTPVTDAIATLDIAPVTGGVVGAYGPAPNNDGSGSNAFVYEKKEYQLNLATRNMSPGLWSLRVTVNGAVASEFRITVGK